ncbi:HNH endonuclease [Paenibacillus tuaregi]|uniref:HNH endonuclease n=1 Tax=Paenibacillus tuaregi TaxID=1816681 RepID=UPI0037093D22
MIYSGKNHPCYNPDITDEERISKRKFPEYLLWRGDVFLRDSYTCTCCGDARGGNLTAHHIFNYSEHPHLRLSVYNGVTMCVDCHKKFHDTFGYTKNNLDQLIEFFRECGGDVSTLFALEGTLIPSQAC